MQLKTQAEIDELIRYVRFHEGAKAMPTDNHARNWLNQAIPNWLEVHDTKITYSERIGTND